VLNRNDEPGTLAVFKLPVKITWALVLAVAVVVVIYLYYAASARRDDLKFAISVIGGAAALYGAYYGGASLRRTARVSSATAALAITKELNSIDMAKIRTLIDRELKNTKLSPHEIYERIMGDDALLSALTTYLGVLEDASIAIQFDAAHEEILHRSFSFLVPWTMDGLRHYIEEERRRNGDQTLYCELERLSVAWHQGLYLSNGRTIKQSAR